MVIRVVSAEDSYLIREGMRLLFDTQEDLELVASTENLPALLDAVDEQARGGRHRHPDAADEP